MECWCSVINATKDLNNEKDQSLIAVTPKYQCPQTETKLESISSTFDFYWYANFQIGKMLESILAKKNPLTAFVKKISLAKLCSLCLTSISF